MKYFIAYVGTENQHLDNLIVRCRDLFDMMPNVNSCIVLTISDEMHISEVSKDEFFAQYSNLN